MNSLSLKEWLSLLELDYQLEGVVQNVNISSVSIDTRTLESGAAFFALQGEKGDGHQFVEQAIGKGAAVCVVRKDWHSPNSSPVSGLILRTNSPLFTLQTLATNYRRQFTLPVLALTGTNGKTSSKEMAAAVLAKRYRLIKTPGNLNNHIGTPLSLLQIQNDTEIAVIEMGSNHSGEIQRLCEIAAPTHGLITNIGAGHLEFFGTLENVARAKAELFDSLLEDGTAFVNVDDFWVKQIAERIKNQVRFGLSSKADVTAEYLEMNERGCVRFCLQNEIEIQLQVPGRHQIYNALAAAAVGIHWSVPLDEIALALANYISYSKRLEWLELAEAVILLDAYNSNPDSLRVALETLVYVADKRKGRAIAVLGDMLELGEKSQSAHEQAGHWAASQKVAPLLLFGPSARFYAIGYRQGGGCEVQLFTDKKDLADTLYQQLKKNDVVLIKGSRGMAMETVWQDLQRLAGK